MKKLAILLMVLCVLFTGCGFAGETYRNYVKAVLDCTYHEEYQAYQELTKASQLASEEIYETEEAALSQRLRDTYGVRTDMISEELIQEYTELAGTILKKTKYIVRDVIGNGANYTVVLVVSPIDFWEKAQEDIQEYYDGEFTEKYAKAPTRTAADRLEEEYASHVLEILTEHAETLAYLEPVIYTFTIENNGVTSQIWKDIDELILNLG